MKKTLLAALFVSVSLLAGCAGVPQAPVPLSNTVTAPDAGAIGVVMTKLPKVDTAFPGADCLLCLAAASVANSSLTKYVQTLSYEDLPALAETIAEQLRKKGLKVVVISDPVVLDSLPARDKKELNFAERNFSAFKEKHKIDRILVIEINQLGIVRQYSAYVPVADPRAVMKGKGYIVNLSNNGLEWYLPVSVAKGTDQKWDEPPSFPGLTNAYFQVIEMGKDEFAKTFLP